MSRTTERPKPIVFARLIRLLLLACGAFYVIALLVVGFNQRWFIYPAPKFTSQEIDQMARRANLERWTNSAGGFIGLKRLSPEQPATGSLLITYGNGEAAVNYAGYAGAIQSIAPLDVFILEYPGYADRSGKPSQENLFRAADEAFQLLPANKPIYLDGQSLGTGVAAYLAGTHPNNVAGVVLVSPYNCLTDVAQHHMRIFPVRWMLIDRYPSEDYLRNYHGPVGVVVDGHDTVIPEEFGLRLYNGYAGPKRLWEFPSGEHATIMEPPAQFWREVVEFWRTSTGTGSGGIPPAR